MRVKDAGWWMLLGLLGAGVLTVIVILYPYTWTSHRNFYHAKHGRASRRWVWRGLAWLGCLYAVAVAAAVLAGLVWIVRAAFA